MRFDPSRKPRSFHDSILVANRGKSETAFLALSTVIRFDPPQACLLPSRSFSSSFSSSSLSLLLGSRQAVCACPSVFLSSFREPRGTLFEHAGRSTRFQGKWCTKHNWIAVSCEERHRFKYTYYLSSVKQSLYNTRTPVFDWSPLSFVPTES